MVENDSADICSTGFTVLRTNEKVTPAFLFRYVLSDQFVRPLEELQTGTQYPATSDRIVFDQPIPVPPIAIQVELDQFFSKLEGSVITAKDRLSTIPTLLKKFRQSVLAAACSGQLTADWRENYEPSESASSLLKRIRLDRKLKPPLTFDSEIEVPRDWAATRIGQVCAVATGATPLRTQPAYFGGSIPWITSSAVNDGIVTQANQFITDLAVKETNAKVFPPGTLVVAMYGEGQTRGRVAELGIATATNQALAALLFDGANVDCRSFLKLHFLRNYEEMRTVAAGGVQPNLSLGLIRDSELLLPPPRRASRDRTPCRGPLRPRRFHRIPPRRSQRPSRTHHPSYPR